MNEAIGYVRVSTEEQAREGISMDMQIAKIKSYCDLNDLDLVGIYGDPGLSGKSIENRPGLQAILHMIGDGKIQHLVIYKLDRLSRNTIETLQMVEDIDGKGVALHSIMERLDTKSIIGRFVIRVLASLNEMVREQIVENTLDGLARKRERGGRVGRYARLGYRLDGDRVEPDRREQQAMEKARDYRRDGLSYQEISDVLAELGYLSRSGNPYSKSTLWEMVRMGGDA